MPDERYYNAVVLVSACQYSIMLINLTAVITISLPIDGTRSQYMALRAEAAVEGGNCTLAGGAM